MLAFKPMADGIPTKIHLIKNMYRNMINYEVEFQDKSMPKFFQFHVNTNNGSVNLMLGFDYNDMGHLKYFDVNPLRHPHISFASTNFYKDDIFKIDLLTAMQNYDMNRIGMLLGEYDEVV